MPRPGPERAGRFAPGCILALGLAAAVHAQDHVLAPELDARAPLGVRRPPLRIGYAEVVTRIAPLLLQTVYEPLESPLGGAAPDVAATPIAHADRPAPALAWASPAPGGDTPARASARPRPRGEPHGR